MTEVLVGQDLVRVIGESFIVFDVVSVSLNDMINIRFS